MSVSKTKVTKQLQRFWPLAFTEHLVERSALENVAKREGLVPVAGTPPGTRPIPRARIVVVVVVPSIGRGSTGAAAAVAGIGAAVAAAASAVRGFVQRGPGIVNPALTC